MMEDSAELTRMLVDWSRSGTISAELAECIYPWLRRIASNQLNGTQLSLQTTELLHEAVLSLIQQRDANWHNRTQFFSVAARVIRRSLVDHVRRQRAQKREYTPAGVEPDEVVLTGFDDHPDLIDLDQALTELFELDKDIVRVVELRYFAGLTIDETAECLDIGRSSVIRHWRFASAWLRSRLAPVC